MSTKVRIELVAEYEVSSRSQKTSDKIEDALYNDKYLCGAVRSRIEDELRATVISAGGEVLKFSVSK